MNGKRQAPTLRPRMIASAAVATHLALHPLGAFSRDIHHVIHISVDGLRPDAVLVLGATNLPNYYRLRAEGAFTDNARTDYDYTDTVPNHTTQLTGRGVLGPAGHNWTDNDDPANGATLMSNKRAYVPGVFDVAHDNGLRTGQFAGKSKFSLFSASWNAANAVPDITGDNNGRNKIDVSLNLVENLTNSLALVNALISSMTARPFHYVFLHLADPDLVGHALGWEVTPGSAYCEAVKATDQFLGLIFRMMDGNSQLAGKIALILTSDHGGLAKGHDNPFLREDYTVPFYVWGPGVMSGADLYALNPTTRLDPGTNRPSYSAPIQPVRNGEAANLALKLLGQGPVPGSTINAAQDLALTIPAPTGFRMTVVDTDATVTFTTIPNALYDIQRCDDLRTSSWITIATNILGTGGQVAHTASRTATNLSGFYRVEAHF